MNLLGPDEPGLRWDEETDEVFYNTPRSEHEREVDEFVARIYAEGEHNMGGDA